jgi:uncharacterized protein DUF955
MTRLGLVAGLLVAASGSGGSGGCERRAQDVQSEARLQQTIDQMMPAVERATRLKFKRRPLVLRRERAQVRDYVIRKFDEELPPAELRGASAAYRLFGLISDSLDLRRTLIDLLTEQIAGYYDPDSNALFIRSDIEPFQFRVVMSHELVHALQHQYVNLDSLIEQKRQNDRRSAAQAILEGQATFAQIPVLMPEQRPETLPAGWFWRQRELAAQQQAQMPEFAHAPLWLRETLIFPYLGGAEFVRWFKREYPEKQPYDALMPTSTEQILDPSRYVAGDHPRDVAFEAAPDTVVYEDNLGEFEIRLLLTQLLGSEHRAAAYTSGWDGDRYQVLGAGSDAVVWYTVWDDRPAASRFARGLELAWANRRSAGAPGRRSEIASLTIDGRPAVRLIDAPADWIGWRQLPKVRVRESR